MSIDAKPAGNAAAAFGPLDTCVEAVPGDEVAVDIVARGIPAYSQNNSPWTSVDDYGGIIAFSVEFQYPEDALTVVSVNQSFLLSVSPSSTVGNQSQALPDTNGDDTWINSAVDTSSPPSIPESGNGVLSRVTILIDPTTTPGEYLLVLGPNTGHLDVSGNGYGPNVKDDAFIAVGIPCDVDHDGIADAEDGCPNYPGLPNNAGCPPAGAPAVGGVAGLLAEPASGGGASARSAIYLGLAAVAGALAAAWYFRKLWL
jgi:hypothetical protein